MRYRLACLCRDFLKRYRVASFWWLLAVLSVLILLLAARVLKPKVPTVYGIVDLGEVREGEDTATVLKNRIYLFRDVSDVLRYALQDLTIAGQKPDWLNEEWLEEKLRVDPLDEPTRVRVWLDYGTPAEQADIVNAVLRAYIRYFELANRRRIGEWLTILEADQQKAAKAVQTLEAELANLNAQPSPDASPSLKWRKQQLIADISLFKTEIRQASALTKKIQADASKVPVVVEWAKAP